MKVRVIRVFRVPDCDTRITQNKFGFYKLLPEIPEQNSGFGYFGFGVRVFRVRVSGYGFFAQRHRRFFSALLLSPRLPTSRATELIARGLAQIGERASERWLGG
jgi:hypothetical protein